MIDTIKFLAVTGIEGSRLLINIADIWVIEEKPDRTFFHMIDGNIIRVKDSYEEIVERMIKC
jgi:uncharacterized protein YlzI (FlbEa/FlbD family)